MTDLTKIEKPFGLLDKETQEALKAHADGGGSIEVRITAGWVKTKTPYYYHQITYRAAPKKHKVKLLVYLSEDGKVTVVRKPLRSEEGMIAIKQIEVELTEGEWL